MNSLCLSTPQKALFAKLLGGENLLGECTQKMERSREQKTSGISTDLKEISYGNGVYVAVGNDGTIISSTDTETWTSRDGASGNLWAIDFGNGTFLTGGNDIYRSYDGITWDNISSNSAQAIKYIDYESQKWKSSQNPQFADVR